eukprot:6491225-Amphidinium_carterae.1
MVCAADAPVLSQILFAGATRRVLPTGPLPEHAQVSFSNNHWANSGAVRRTADQGLSDLGLVKHVPEQRVDLVTLVKNATLAIAPTCNKAGWGHIVIADDEWYELLALAHSMQENGRLFDKETQDQHAVDDFCVYDELDIADNLELEETDPEPEWLEPPGLPEAPVQQALQERPAEEQVPKRSMQCQTNTPPQMEINFGFGVTKTSTFEGLRVRATSSETDTLGYHYTMCSLR